MEIYIVVAVIVLLITLIAWAFNSLVAKKARVEEAWSGIDVQLKRRYVLLPQLVELVKAYVKAEGGILENVTRLRSESMNESDLERKAALEDQISQNVRKISVTVEAYPQLKSSDNFIKLMNQLFEIEDQIQMSRRYYNGTVREFNIQVQIFPLNLIAGIFGYKKAEFFEADEDARKDVKVDL